MKTLLILQSLLFIHASVLMAQWKKTSYLKNGNDFYSIHFFSPDEGYICGENGTLFYTNNGGDQWQYITTEINSNLETIWAIWAVDKDTVYFSSSDKVYKTTNGFKSAETILDRGIYKGFQDMYLTSPRTIYGFSSGGRLQRSNNYGKSWTFLINIDYPNGKILYFSGDTGYISNIPGTVFCDPGPCGYTEHSVYKTVDGGENWEKLLIERFNYVDFKSKNIGYYSFDDYENRQYPFFKTADGGKTWYSHGVLPENLIDIEFINDSVFYGSPLENRIFRSGNEGITWKHEIVTNDNRTSELYYTGKWLFALCKNGNIYRKPILHKDSITNFSFGGIFNGNSSQEAETFHFTLNHDTLIMHGSIYANSCGNHYLTYQIDSNVININRVDTGMLCSDYTVYNFELKIPDCNLNKYKVKLNKYHGSGLDTLVYTNSLISNQKYRVVEDLSINVYPNPINSVIQISFNRPVNNLSYEIFNSAGILMRADAFKHQLEALDVEVPGYTPGIYYLHINNETHIETFKIIIR